MKAIHEKIENIFPLVSVIIPASRPHRAAQTLQTLQEQNYTGKVEIIVVGPPAATLSNDWPILAVHPEQIREPGRARNIGAAHATGDILLFLDDDMLVEKDWIARNVLVLQQAQVGIVGARMPGKSTAFFARCADFTNCGYYQHGQAMDVTLGAGSMGIQRKVFQEVGGFDEMLCSSEDIDLCYRVHKQGYRTLYQPEIVVIHDHAYDTLWKLLMHNYAHGYSGGLITKIRHQDAGVKNLLLYHVRSPLIFLFFLPAIAVLASIQIVKLNIREHKRVLCYAPFILLGKLAYETGIFIHLLQNKESNIKCGEHYKSTYAEGALPFSKH